MILFSRTEVGSYLSLGFITKLTEIQSKLAEVSKEIQSKYPGLKIHYASVDVQDYDNVKAGVENAIKAIGDIDILVNNVRLRDKFAMETFAVLT